MPKGPKGEKRPADVIGAAVMVGKIATGEIEDVGGPAPGRARGGKAGGRARAKKLTTGPVFANDGGNRKLEVYSVASPSPKVMDF